MQIVKAIESYKPPHIHNTIPGVGSQVEHQECSVDECMSTDERKQHDCDQNTFVHSQKCIKLKHIKVVCKFLQSSFFISFETLISNMRCIWLNCKMLINFNIFVNLGIIFSALLKQ